MTEFESIANKVYQTGLSFLQNDKISDYSKLKAVADNNLNIVQIIIPMFDRVENIVGRAFSPFPAILLKVFFSGLLNVGIV